MGQFDNTRTPLPVALRDDSAGASVRATDRGVTASQVEARSTDARLDGVLLLLQAIRDGLGR